MENPNVNIPNFVLIKRNNNKGPFFKVTVCKHTLAVLSEEQISEIPEGWTFQDFMDSINEGKRFFS